MVIPIESYNSSVIEWREREGVIEVLVLDSTPTNPDFPDDVQTKFPGGGGEEGESPEDTARREFKDETGRSIREDAKLKPIYSRLVADHHKVGFLVHESDCEGQLDEVPRLEGDSIINNRRYLTIDQVIADIYQPRHNQTQLHLVRNAKREIEKILLTRALQKV
ncbi:NUDIX domain-containing protein [Candidatus Parcubacteria bacterium]|nr:NUDIX domain-containing protein [Candidatus Parcubacteria bacterium]